MSNGDLVPPRWNLEPMFMAGGDDRYLVDSDGWALRTSDGSLAAHVEHTVAITDSGPVVLTIDDDQEP